MAAMATRTATGGDPRVRRTRRLLLGAFEELLAEKGFQALTVQDVAERAEVNRATFYAHFDDKYALLDYHNRTGLQERLTRAVPPTAALTADTLRALALAVFEHLSRVSGCRRRPADERLLPLFEAAVQHEVEAFVRAWLGRLTPTDGPEQTKAAASVISWSIFGAGVAWSRAEAPEPADAVVGRVADVLLTGVAH